jgi:hypothetical protein
MIHALKKLHATMARELRENMAQGKKIRDGLEHIEAVLKLLDPKMNQLSLSAKRREYNRKRLGHGEPVRVAYDILRAATKPLHAREIAALVYRSRGIEPAKTNVDSLSHSLRRAFERQRGKTMTGDKLYPERWTLTG